jgi:hypothetical protein
MLNFKQFINESDKHDDQNDEVEYEGLDELLSHHFYNNDVPPEIEKHILSHKPLNEEEETDTDKFVHGEVKKALKRHKEVYGKDIGEPVKPEDAPEIGRKAVEEHFNKSPEEQHASLKLAAKRIGHVAYGDKNINPKTLAKRISSGNRKTDTVINNKLVKYKGKLTSAVSSYGGAAGNYEHHHSGENDDVKHTKVTTCEHATSGCMSGGKINTTDNKGAEKAIKVGASCLAKSGAYNFPGVRKKVQINSHIRSGHDTIKDHAILVAHHLQNEAKDAEKKDTVHSVRGQTTDERGKDISAIANETAKHDPSVKKNTVLFGYTKSPKEALDASRKTKKGDGVPEVIAHSHPGPAVYRDGNGKAQLNVKTIQRLKGLRHAHETAKKEGLHINDYVVAGGKSLDENGNGIDGSVYSQLRTPGKKATAEKKASHAVEKARFNRVDGSIKKVRYWDLHHSGELKPGEKPDHHDEKTGTGHTTVVQDGKQLKIGYHDRDANVGDTDSGHTTYAERHDGRYADGENKKSSSHVTASVSSGSNIAKSGAFKNALTHQMEEHFDMHGDKKRHSAPGTLHEAHPDMMKEAGHKYEDKDTTYKNHVDGEDTTPKRKVIPIKAQ